MSARYDVFRAPTPSDEDPSVTYSKHVFSRFRSNFFCYFVFKIFSEDDPGMGFEGGERGKDE